MKAHVILNARAGSAPTSEDIIAQIRQTPGVILHEPANAEEAVITTRQSASEGADLIVAAGGDGTINNVLEGLAPEFSVRFGIIPLGTGNDLCRSLDLRAEWEALVAAAQEDRTRAIDVVKTESPVGVKFYLNASIGGMGTAVSEKMEEADKSWLGPIAYWKSALQTIHEFEATRCDIHVDDQPPRTIKVINTVVSNGRYVAGGLPIAPNALVDDGRLDLLVFPELSALEIASLAPSVLLGTHWEDSRLWTARCRHVVIKPHAPMKFNLDGEIIGEGPITYEIQPRKIQLVQPAYVLAGTA